MLTINQLECQLKLLENELKLCVEANEFSDSARILTGISTLKDTLLESYRKTYAKSIVGSISNPDIDIFKDSTANITIPLRIVK